MPALAIALIVAQFHSRQGEALAAAYMGTHPASIAADQAPAASDYPDQARHDYVDVCSAVNGRTPQAQRACTCSINVIASILPYSDYERAETIMRMRQLGGGYLAQEFRVKTANDTLHALQQAQAEAEVRCF